MANQDFIHYPLEELVYANALEKAYGITDELYEYYCRQQMRLERFNHAPFCSRDLQETLSLLDRKGAWLRAQGFDPTTEDNVFEVARIDFVHSTAALEGNTMSVHDVAMVLQEDEVSPAHPMREHLEIICINEAFDLMVSFVREKRLLDASLIKQIHAVAARALDDCELGEYRWDQRYVTTSRILPPPPASVGELCERAISWYNAEPSIERAALFHLVFEDIHPFQDGNGRTGRIVLNFMLMSLGFPVVALKPDHESNVAYHAAMDEFVKSVEERDGSAFVSQFAAALDMSIGRCALEIEQRQAQGR